MCACGRLNNNNNNWTTQHLAMVKAVATAGGLAGCSALRVVVRQLHCAATPQDTRR